jgi:hypothetical protein
MLLKQIKQKQEKKGRETYGDQLDAHSGILQRLSTEKEIVDNGLEEVVDAINYFESAMCKSDDLMLKGKYSKTLYYLREIVSQYE